MPKRSNGFDKDPERASRAGKKSTRHTPEDLKTARDQFRLDFESKVYKYQSTSLSTLKKIAKDKSTPAGDLIVIAIVINALEKGDNARLAFLLDRTIGKVKDVSEVSVKSSHRTVLDQLLGKGDKDE